MPVLLFSVSNCEADMGEANEISDILLEVQEVWCGKTSCIFLVAVD